MTAETSQDKHIADNKTVGFSPLHHDIKHNDARRHYRMLDNVIPIINAYGTDNTWLTVGDDRGREAIYLKKQKIKNVICSSLKHFHADDIRNFGNIDKTMDVDIENIPIDDDGVDFSFCKESFHHFPRPFLGLYEMLRCSKKGVILMEPQESEQPSFPNCLGRGGPVGRDSYEQVGNYKYEVSAREICKAAWALYYPHVAMCGFNDHVHTFVNEDGNYDFSDSEYKWEEYVDKTEREEVDGRMGHRSHSLILCAILKQKLDKEQRDILNSNNYVIFDRPMNEYIEDRL